MQSELIHEVTKTLNILLENSSLESSTPELSSIKDETLRQVLSELIKKHLLQQNNIEQKNHRIEELENRLRETEALFEAAKVLTSTLEFEPLLEATTDKFKEIFELTDGAAMFLYDPVKGKLEMVTSIGYPKYPRTTYLSPGEGAPGTVFVLRKPILANGTEQMAALYQSIQGESRHTLEEFMQSHPLPSQSVICIPFIARDKVIGSLQLEHWTDTRKFTENDLNLFIRLADLIAIAVDNGLLWRELQEKEDRLRLLVGQLINAQEKERKWIARELHDDAGQVLTTIAIGLNSIINNMQQEQSEMLDKVVGLRNDVKDIMGHMRDLTFAISPSILDDLGLVAALKWYVDRFKSPEYPKIELSLDKRGKNIQSLAATVLFRITQESLNNAFRYSQATHIQLNLNIINDAIKLEIKDNGNGFDVEKVMKIPQESIGLYGMSERVALLGGSLQVLSSLGKGTTIQAGIPLTDSIYQKEAVE